MGNTTMKRLKGFDYTKPYFYMVTLKRVKGLAPFCEITKEVEPPKDAQGRQYEKYCAEGRMLFLSLYPVLDRLPTKSELYRRCHEMGDIVVAGLGERT